MARNILIRGARQLLTLHGPPPPRRGTALRDLGIINDGSILIRDGRIYEANTSRRVEALIEARNAEEISALGRVVLPGFVDSHTRVIAGPSGIQQISRRTLENQGLRLLEDFVRHGTTTLGARSGFGTNERGELKILRAHAALSRRTSMLVSTFTATAPPTSSALDEYIESLCSHLLPMIKRRGLAECADICCEGNPFSMDHVRRYLTLAKHQGFLPKMHAGPAARMGTIAEAIRLGVASVDVPLCVNEEDIRALADSDTVATLLPGSVFFAGTENYTPARALIDGGAAVALATNYNARSSPSYSMQMMIALACRKMGMTVEEAISAATINGAYSLRRSNQAGLLENGQPADIIILAVSDYREIPYHFGVNMVDMAFRRGEIAYRRSDVRWPRSQ